MQQLRDDGHLLAHLGGSQELQNVGTLQAKMWGHCIQNVGTLHSNFCLMVCLQWGLMPTGSIISWEIQWRGPAHSAFHMMLAGSHDQEWHPCVSCNPRVYLSKERHSWHLHARV